MEHNPTKWLDASVDEALDIVYQKVQLEHRAIICQFAENVCLEFVMDACEVHEAGRFTVHPVFVELKEQIAIEFVEMLDGRLRCVEIVDVRFGHAGLQQCVRHRC